MTADRELEQWQAEWQSQTTPDVDVATLRDRVRRRNRREKQITGLEILATIVVAGLAFFLASTLPELRTAERAGIGLLMLGATGFSVWSVLERRRHWREATLDIRTLVEIEKSRIKTRLRYWRVSAWIITGLCVGLAGLAIADASINPGATDRIEGWFLSLAANLPVLFVTAVWGHLVHRRTQKQWRELAFMTDSHDP